MTSNSNGTAPAEPRRTFPDNHRHLAPGETVEAGDQMLDHDAGWIPVTASEIGQMVTVWSGRLYARDGAKGPLPDVILHRALARFAALCCDRLYEIENMVTAERAASHCHCCGVPGEPDINMLIAMVEGLAADGTLTSQEAEELELVDDDDDEYIEVYEAIRARIARDEDDERQLPSVPMEYDHTEECTAWFWWRVLHGFDSVFSTYLSSHGIDRALGRDPANDILDPSTADNDG